MHFDIREFYVATETVDLRASFRVLSGYVRERLGHEPESGAVFVFVGKRKGILKALFYHHNGYCILYKRLNKGIFKIPETKHGEDSVEIDEIDFKILLDAIQSNKLKKKMKKILH